MPTDIYIVVTPAGVGAAFLALLVFVCVVFCLGVIAGRPWPLWSKPGGDGGDGECAETQELPRRQPRRPHTGAVHATQYERAGVDEPTVVIEQAGRRH